MENQKEIRQNQFICSWKIFFWEAVLFSLTLGLGIISAFKLSRFLKFQEIALKQISFWEFLLYFLLTTLFILAVSFLVRFKKGKRMIFKAIFVLAVILGGLISLDLWMPDLLGLLFMFILILAWLKNPLVFLHDFIMVLGLAGVGASLGLRVTPLLAVTLLMIFSIYDYIAVYKTKHMIKMAKEMLAEQAILGFVIPQGISGFKESLKEIKPGSRFLILGGGDVAFPLVLCISLLPEGIINSLIVALFALVGLFASFYFFINQPYISTSGSRKPIPALPPIAFFSIIGFLITLFL